MLNYRQTLRRGPAVLLVLALSALVTVAVTGFGKDLRRAKSDPGEAAARGRIQTQPMTMIQGVLSRGSGGDWTLDGRAVRFERDCTLLNQTNPDGGGGPASGDRAVLMGYPRPGEFLVYTGLILQASGDEPPSNDAAQSLMRPSDIDPTVGEADPNIPK
ncbi:MAG: hypothetical protein ACYDIE_04650 [Candidatus Krumholzibacteriia bacterium]